MFSAKVICPSAAAAARGADDARARMRTSASAEDGATRRAMAGHRTPAPCGVESGPTATRAVPRTGGCVMAARPVVYPNAIEPLVRFVEETAPEHIVARANERLAAGTSVRDMLLASALAVVRSSDLPPGHHGGPLHPLAGLHAVRHIAARLPGEYGRMPVIQNVAVANKHIHSPAMGPYMLADAAPVSEKDDPEATVRSFHQAASRGVYNACDHYYLYLLEHLSPYRVLGELLEVAVPKNQLDDHYFLFPVFTWRALEYFGWEYARYIGRAPVRYITRPTAPATTADVDELIRRYELLERDLRAESGDDEAPAITALADQIGRVND